MSQNCAVILAGGQGKRMKSDYPKPMLKVLGEPMIDWVIKACENAGIENICVVTGFKHEIIEEHLAGKHTTVLQSPSLGTGHAVLQCVDFLNKFTEGNTVILCGDAPFIDKETINNALQLHEDEKNAVTVVSANTDDNTGYGRILRNGKGIAGIVEEKDCTPQQRAVTEINSGVYWFNTLNLLDSLKELKPVNAQGEYYLTDTIEILINKGLKADAFLSSEQYFYLGANDRAGMLKLNEIARNSEIEKHLANGVCINCADGIIIEQGVKIGAGTEILQGTILRKNTVIGENCVIGPNCLIENSTIGNNTILNYVQSNESTVGNNVKIGPFVQLRPNSHIKDFVKIGDFVEIKNSTIDERTAVAHLTYVGDSDVGKHVNFGCGCVTVNYDGENKYRTTIKDNAFIGCNTNLIAPVTVGEGGYTAAGTTVVKDVPDNALALDRGEFRIKEGYAEKKLRIRSQS